MKTLIVAMSLTVMSLMAADYSALTLDELNSLRGTIAIEDRDDFRAEMQSRIDTMTPDELAKFQEDRKATRGAGLRDGSGVGSMNQGNTRQNEGMGQRLRDGSGSGGMGQGNGRK
ncbi:MAG: hypothetical protein U9P72_10260 [Campylobacterota bacterium]|nr:hypothetical protein [Campylobacterota bacterium]